ncbi:DEAD/DEAH box helicase [Dietzia sp. 179-F 9C3 NHS]|uniref:DEAD/DEAH box helicase n=1 Tax=Dietzia sp. 179-F 9C3 NHS TaxID=3374295 RepID=UPI0038794DD3
MTVDSGDAGEGGGVGGSDVAAHTVAARPRLHAVWDSGVVSLWCDTGLGRPRSVAPAASVTAVARAGAPDEVVSLLGAARLAHRVTVSVPVEGRVRAATVPGIRISLARALELADHALPGRAGAVPHGGIPHASAPDWAGAGLRALATLSAGVAAFVSAGHVVPVLTRLDGAWDASWRLVASPTVAAWTAESADRCHGLVAGREELDRLLAALADHHARAALAPLAADRRSELGAALVSGGEVASAGQALAEAVREFGRAAVARDVDVVFRIAEPGEDTADPAAPAWRLEVLVRAGGDALRPYGELPDPAAVAEPVRDVVDRAVRAWTPLGHADPAETGPDLLLTPDLVVDLVDTGIEALRGHGVEVLLPRAWTRVRTAVRVVVPEPGTEAVDTGRRLGLDQLADVDWEMVVDDEPVDAVELQQMLDSASDLVRLRGRWVRADAGALRRAARFLALRRGERTTPAALVAALASEEAEGVEVEGPTTLAWTAAADPGPTALPDWFAATLRPYQQEGLDWLAALAASGTGAVLADDMGLGKTVQVLALTAAEHAAGPRGPTLVVAPLTLVSTWRREAERFARELTVAVHHGPGRARGEGAAEVLGAADLVLTSYGTASRDVELLSTVPWRRVVADEAQTVKNPSTAVARALRTIGAEHRVALTGTPVENRLDELRAVFDFANPGLLGSASTFRARFAVPVESHRDEAAAARLRTLAAPFVLRRLKSDPRVMADLPDKLHIRVDAPLTHEQVSLYQAVVEDMMEQVSQAEGASRKGAILSGLTALKQVCNHPAHYLGDGSGLLRGGRHRSGKVAALDEVLAEILDAGEKVLLFTQYRAFGDLLLPLLERRSAGAVPFLHGGVSAAGRAEMVRDFQSPDGPRVMLASLKAGGTGLTLTEANHVVHLDRWWNPAVENQATDRVHRIGQTRTVQVRTMVAPGTVEDRIDELLVAKRELADMTLGPLAGALTELGDEELAQVISLADYVRSREGEP